MGIWDDVSNAMDAAGDAASAAYDTNKKAMQKAAEVARDAAEGAADLAGKAYDTNKKALQKAAEAAEEAAEGAAEIARKAYETNKKAMEKVAEAAKEAAAKAAEIARKAYETNKKALEQAKQKIKEQFQKKEPDKPAIPCPPPPPPTPIGPPPPPPPALGGHVNWASNPVIDKSPTLQRQLRDLEAAGWKINYGPAGGGSTCSKSGKEIILDLNSATNPAGMAQTLAHEAGHAFYTGAVDDSSRQNFIDSMLADEGAATVNNVKVQREINRAGGPDIGIAGNPTNQPQYNAAYDEFERTGDAAKAQKAIGTIFGRGERTSNTNQTYEDYYGGDYDRRHPPTPPPASPSPPPTTT